MEDYAKSLEEIQIRDAKVDKPLTRDELKVLRKFVGKLNWLAANTRPDLAIYALDLAKGQKKVDFYSIACEEFELKDYFNNLNLINSRTKYRERSSCIQTCRSQASSDMANMLASHRCYGCMSQDVISHWWSCPSYSHLTKNRSILSDADVCGFYRDVIQLRQQQERKPDQSAT